MFDIRFYFKPEKPMNYNKVKVIFDRKKSAYKISKDDKNKIDRIWNDLKKGESNIFSVPGSLGNLYNIQNNFFIYSSSEFKINMAAALTYKKRLFKESFYESIRTSVVGCALRLIEDTIVIHKRSKNVSHCKDIIDCSAAGYVHIEDNKINFEKSLLGKLERELGVKERNIKNIYLTSVHATRCIDFAGTFSFLVDTNLNKDDVQKMANKNYISELYFIKQERLPDFIVEHFSIKKDMAGVGCATLLSILDSKIFSKTIRKLREKGKKIEFGKLNEGVFIEETPNQ